VRVGNVVEGEDAKAESEEEVCAKGHESPEGKHRNDLLLDQGRKRDELEKESKVEGGDEEGERDGLLSACHFGGLGKERELERARGSLRLRLMMSVLEETCIKLSGVAWKGNRMTKVEQRVLGNHAGVIDTRWQFEVRDSLV
jgi:hypothetical protein